MRVPALLLLLLSTGAALAQPAPPPVVHEPETVYSDAELERDQSISRQTVNSVLDPVWSMDDQYARWKTPICFNVYGFSATAKYVVERRMKDIAAQVGAPVDRNDPCVPNVTIAVTPDPAATLASVHAARRALLPNYGFIAAELKQSQPVQAWYGVSVRGTSGREELLFDGFNDGIPDERRFGAMSGELSRLNTGLSTALQTVLIVADTKALMGKSLGTLADHFAMLALAQARDTRRCKDVATIANLMNQNCTADYRPEAITGNDLALLSAIYQTPDLAMQKMQRQRIIGNMRRSLESQATGKPVAMK
jgi:hypothetical protein